MLAAIAVPLVVALVSVSRETWYPTGDMAQAELHVAGFFRHPPLVGAAGRIGSMFTPYGQGSHPGPALWVALLPMYLLTGRSSFGIELGMTLLQFGFIAATVLTVRRVYGAIGGLVVASVAAVLVHALGPAPFLEPWNPWGGLFAFFWFISLCWGIMCGHHRFLPAAAFAGFFAVQCHTGYALLVGATLAVMVGFVAWQWRHAARDEPDGPGSRRGDPSFVVDRCGRDRCHVAAAGDRPVAPPAGQPAHLVELLHGQHRGRRFATRVRWCGIGAQGLRRGVCPTRAVDPRRDRSPHRSRRTSSPSLLP